ncbi:major facilitator transporter [Devosia limi DSM 17137]|uniref:MFS transporter, DHA2 family, lincomycin resistance protein n=1 Tax=Devosia limi DSM 17137 TaxID=1121477 RepID=A0A0F5LM87_9HYPH|nr:MDR family MFS transporter [Devosia limi]KKB82737.1 major facilitator transporter [Devosia limi DSM 17137]SHE40894.1 MFS transporter, DHA2 family, lincomycin resistance protein [Devosia limi DSM 17137]
MTTDTANFTAPAIDADTASRNKLVIAILLVSAFIVILNETIMGVALPHLMADLDITASAAQWLTTAFMLTMAVVIPITGYLLQRLNTRPVFMLAMSLFSTGTLICAIAPDFAFLVAGRVVQASGTAIMMPLLMTTVMNLVPAESRGKTMGNISIVISVAPAIGPTISGLILAVLDWRWMFLLVLPIALGGLALGATRIQNVTTPTKAPLDLLSVLLSAVGFGGFVYGLSGLGEAASHPSAVPAWIPLVIGIVVIGLFVLRQLALQKQDRALLDLRTLTSKNFSISVALMAIAMMAMFGAMILLPMYLQNVLGLTTLQTGLLMLPGGLVMGLFAPVVGSLYDKHGPTVLLVPGTALVSLALWGLSLVDQHTQFYWLLAAHLVLSVGLSLIFTPLFSASLGSLQPRFYSHGSAMIGTTQQVAGAAGTALFVALMTLQSTSLVAGGAGTVEALAGGIRLAFTVGAVIAMFSVVAALFVRKPEGEGASGHHGH